jgi:uncharacterized protein YbaR (Trm112 family)
MSRSSFAALLACPACRAALVEEEPGHRCSGCGVAFPELDGVPWLLPEPAEALWEWKGRIKVLVQRLDAETNGLKGELKAEGLPELTAKRLRKLLQAKVEHRKALDELLAPLAMAETGSLDLSRAMQARVPPGQSLTGYYVNVHRDWAWETVENEASLAAVEAVLPAGDVGTVLALGAGACRLPYDLHRKRKPRLTIAADINPLMMIIARRVLKGRSVKLHEFPLAPKDLESHAVLRKCVAPEAPLAGLELVFADALRPPFADGAFDMVVTPWLVDIIPADLKQLALRVNRLLKPGGSWVNFGSLAFNHGAQALNYSYEEALAVVESQGFGVKGVDRRTIPYMQSPASCHGRMEATTTFRAEKTGEQPAAAPYRYLPDWLTKVDAPIPRLKGFDSFMTVQAILLEAVALVDGKRTLRDVATAFGARHGLPVAEAESSLRGFFLRQYEEGLTGQQY